MQAAGKERLPIISIIVGGAVKIGVNWVLVGDPRVNITGAPIGSICCFAAMCAADYVFLCRTLSRRPRLRRVLGAPMLSCAVMISVTGALTREDMALIPHGEKIGDLLRLKSAKK